MDAVMELKNSNEDQRPSPGGSRKAAGRDASKRMDSMLGPWRTS
jgi:hypothetical protein